LQISQSDLDVGEHIGGGSLGVVFKGTWRGRGGHSTVAIKKVSFSTPNLINSKLIISQIHTQDKETVLDICKELNTIASLRFQHICQVHGACIINEKEVWLVLEFVEGGNLHDFILNHRPLSWEMQISFAIQAAKALNFLHSSSTPILHQGIKSSSFLIRDRSKLLLTDFVLAKTKNLVTAQTFDVGALKWAAPEVLTEDPPRVSEKSDIYSLGLVFFEIVSGELPFLREMNIRNL
jgi:serine/threonine protein kinase